MDLIGTVLGYFDLEQLEIGLIMKYEGNQSFSGLVIAEVFSFRLLIAERDKM